jgi:dipeptidyl aminopeptidase/acylaminoacyl peptidase
VEAPILVICGSCDILCAHTSNELFSVLRRLGKRARFAQYQGESHWPGTWSTASQRDYYQRLLDWFDSHLGVE